MQHQAIITELGGIRALARKLEHSSHTTVQGWFDRNQIPLDRWEEVITAAKAEGKTFTANDFLPDGLKTQADAA